MLDKVKELWARWKVQVSVVGGVLVIVTAYGQCTYEPPAVDEVETQETETTETTGTTTETTGAETTGTTTETTGTTTETTGTED